MIWIGDITGIHSDAWMYYFWKDYFGSELIGIDKKQDAWKSITNDQLIYHATSIRELEELDSSILLANNSVIIPDIKGLFRPTRLDNINGIKIGNIQPGITPIFNDITPFNLSIPIKNPDIKSKYINEELFPIKNEKFRFGLILDEYELENGFEDVIVSYVSGFTKNDNIRLVCFIITSDQVILNKFIERLDSVSLMFAHKNEILPTIQIVNSTNQLSYFKFIKSCDVCIHTPKLIPNVNFHLLNALRMGKPIITTANSKIQNSQDYLDVKYDWWSDSLSRMNENILTIPSTLDIGFDSFGLDIDSDITIKYWSLVNRWELKNKMKSIFTKIISSRGKQRVYKSRFNDYNFTLENIFSS